MEFLFEYLEMKRDMKIYNTTTPYGFVDCNIHIPENHDYLPLRRRNRKIVKWEYENNKLIPYFKKGDSYVRAFLIHFQGPGKRVFYRFNSAETRNLAIRKRLLNIIFQNRLIASLT
jgi:hypothetical protein